jgi:hypothetical protein
MSTLSHHSLSDHSLALQSATNVRPAGDFEHSLAHASLRRVEAKEFLFAEGDAASHLYRIETGAIAFYKVIRLNFSTSRSWRASPPASNRPPTGRPSNLERGIKH